MILSVCDKLHCSFVPYHRDSFGLGCLRPIIGCSGLIYISKVQSALK